MSKPPKETGRDSGEVFHSVTLLSLSELPITEIEIELIAAAAIIGDKKILLLKIKLLQSLLR